jgi:hypothetical protein
MYGSAFILYRVSIVSPLNAWDTSDQFGVPWLQPIRRPVGKHPMESGSERGGTTEPRDIVSQHQSKLVAGEIKEANGIGLIFGPESLKGGSNRTVFASFTNARPQ